MSGENKRTALICLALFALAFFVRIIVWQSNMAAIDNVQHVVTHVYKQDARLLVRGDVRTFLAGPDPPSDATIIMHPPGYPLFIAAVYSLLGENESLRIIQIILNSVAPILVFLITLLLVGERTAMIAGVLTAFAPQFAYHSAIILPDELSVLPILLGLYFFVHALQEKRLAMVVLAGVLLGLSCWLRSNALLLPPFFAAAVLLVFPKGWRLMPTGALLAAFMLTIAPITIRNYVVFDAFVPVSVGFGTTFIEGLGEMDTTARTGMPTTDEGVMQMDAERAGRPDYYGNLYAPDGIARERDRFAAGLAVVRADPGWYAANILKRGSMAFRMERVPVIATMFDEGNSATPLFYYLNVPLKLVQRLFITAVFLPLFLIGCYLLLRGKDRDKLVVLLIVPLYYFLVQPLVHTEYRYLLPATHVLIILSAYGLSSLLERILNARGLAGA